MAMAVAARPRLRRTAWLVAVALAAMGASADVLPTRPQVVGGAAAVSRVGDQQTVQQFSDRAIIEWGSFSIGAGASVRFLQPRSTSVVLNRVVGDDPSRILGTMSANGQVFLVNPNGVFFGLGARVDTGALVASTMDIANGDFLAGHLLFTRGGGTGRVENAGTITIRDGGYALLAADDVRNTGRIDAPRGNVMLASAARVTIDTREDGLVGFSVSGGALRDVARVENAGAIVADGGRIALSARGARELTGMVVNNTGVLRAASIEERDGAVILSADAGATTSTGRIDVSGVRGGLIEVGNASGTASVAGTLDARGWAGAGGSVRVAGAATGVMGGAVIDASGTTGGAVRIGGDWRGGELALADGQRLVSRDTYVAQSATMAADGRGGVGGSVVVWADGTARFDGQLSARGAGDAAGGQAEISGRALLDLRGGADLRSDRGAAGTLLLDPAKILITDSAGDGSAGNPAGSADGDLPTIPVGNPGATSTLSRGKLEGIAGNANIVLEATDEIRLANLAGNELALATGSANSVTLRTTGGTSRIVFDDPNDRIRTGGGAINVVSGGSIDIGRLGSQGGAVTLSGGGAVRARAIDSGGGVVQMSGGAVAAGTINSGGGGVQLSGSAVAVDRIDSGNGLVRLDAAQAIDAGTIRAGSGDVRLTAGTNVLTGDIDTGGTVRYQAGGTVNQRGGTRVRAGRVTVAAAGGVALNGDNEVDAFSASTTGATSFRSRRDLTVDASTVDGASLDVRTSGKLSVGGAVRVDGGGQTGSLYLEAGNGIDVGGQSLEVRGSGGYGERAADLTLRASGGNITQSGGSITAAASGTQAASTSQLAHYAEVTLSADRGRVDVQNVSATSVDGRAQVNLNGHDGVAVRVRAEAIAASQPGVVINAQYKDGNADVDTRGATVRTVLTAEAAVYDPQSDSTVYKYVSKPAEDVGGIGIAGRHLELGTVEAVASDALKASRARAASLAGISTLSHGNTTFHGTVRTDSLTGINVGTSNDGTVVTNGGILRGPALSISGDPKVYGRGVFRLTTDVDTLTVVGGRGVDIDNTSHAGQLVINALGRISPETTLPSGEVAEATTMPVGGFRIRSRSIKLLSLDNRTQGTSQYDGANTGGNRQDMVFEADTLEVVPGTIKTRANTLVHLRPLTSNRTIVVGQDATLANPGVTYYSGGAFGLLGMLHPESKVYIGNYGDQTGYTGDILIGGTSGVYDLGKQISLGSMELHFYTAGNGRVINNYGSNDAMPVAWKPGAAPTEATLLCPTGQACLARMTDDRIYLRDSRMVGDHREARYVYVTGQGTGAGGTRPENDKGVDSSGGGSGPGGGPGGSSGGGSNNNDSGPGGSNQPPTGPGGGGNDQNQPGDLSPVVSNPGQESGNPGPGPDDPTDPGSPGSDPGASTGDDGGLSGGGDWSGSDPDDGPIGGGTTVPGDPTGSAEPVGGGETNDPSGPGGPAGGGEISDPGDPGSATGDPSGPGGPAGGGETNDPSGPGGPTGGSEMSDPGDPGAATGDPSGPGGTTGGGDISDPGGPGDATDGSPGPGGPVSDASDPGDAPGAGTGDPSVPGGSWEQPGESSGGQDGGGAYAGEPGGIDGGVSGGGGGPSDGGTGPGSAGDGGGAAGDGPVGDGDGGFGGGGSGGVADSGSNGGADSGGGGSYGGDATDGSGGWDGGAGTGNQGGSDSGSPWRSDAQDGGSSMPGASGTGQASGGQGAEADGTGTADSTGPGRGGQGDTQNGGPDLAGGASGEASGEASASDGSQLQDGGTPGAAGEQAGRRQAGADEEFIGGASGGARSQASGDGATGMTAGPVPPPCEDESEQVRALSRPGEPNPGLLSVRASGMRLRNESGTLQQQRRECARLVPRQ